MKIFLVLLVSILSVFSSFAIEWNLPWIKLISRKEWGANSKYLFADYKAYQNIIRQNKDLDYKIAKYPSKYQNIIKKRQIEKDRKNYMLSNRKNQIKADKVFYKLDRKKLWWPLWYKFHKTDIIIHHTAVNYDRFNTIPQIEAYIRWVYYYHAIKRWWWDIWYNFLIDKFWNIYEWRQWWPWVIWANSSRNNVDSIWIALIWNFNIQKPTKAQLNTLIKLSTTLVNKYNINPYKKVFYHEKSRKYPYIKTIQNYSIVWHKDTWHTACPWKYLYADLPYIRKEVSLNIKSNDKNKNLNYKTIVFKKQYKTLNLWYKFSLTNNIFIKLKNIDNLSDCMSYISWLSISCKWNTIDLQLKHYFKFWTKLIYAYSKWVEYKIYLYPIFINNIRYLIKKRALKYLWNNVNTHKINKIKYKIYAENIPKLIKQPVKVLLYNLSKFEHYNINCSLKCSIITSHWRIDNIKKLQIDKLNSLIVWIWNKMITTNSITILWNWGEIIFSNYKRKSYAWIPWNSFRWNIAIKKTLIKEIWWLVKNKFAVINMLSIDNYLAGIAESNDQMPFQKVKVMALLAKDYLLFYLNKKNIHPSIPNWVVYNVIDDPRIFQKYVGVWYEKTSKLWAKALEQTKNQYILYKNYIPILPYFSCSPWFTFSAKQKFGRVDTPYLVNNLDLWKCSKFYWHWVWLSWKWAEFLAKKWFNYKQIVQWYFPWVKIEYIK